MLPTQLCYNSLYSIIMVLLTPYSALIQLIPNFNPGVLLENISSLFLSMYATLFQMFLLQIKVSNLTLYGT